jgi:small-conductance mechanosensitive channel
VKLQFSHLHLDSALISVAVLLATIVLARVAGKAFERSAGSANRTLFSYSLYSSLIQIAILIVGVLTVLESLGIAIAPLLTTLGLGGLAVALAANDTLSNLFAGIQIVTARQLRVGDSVRFDFAQGEVVDITWHNTTICDEQNNMIIVPNNKINTNVMTNYSLGGGPLTIPVNAVLAWKGSAAQLREITQNAAGGASVAITAINETNVQVTAYLPVPRMSGRAGRTDEFLDRLYDGARAAGMGAAPPAPR